MRPKPVTWWRILANKTGSGFSNTFAKICDLVGLLS